MRTTKTMEAFQRVITLGRSSLALLGLVALPALATPLKAQRAPIRVPIPVLERYVGEYVYPDGNTIKVLLSGDTLIREIPGQRVAYAPLSETRFRMGGVFTAEFVVDAAGGVTQVLSDGAAVEFRLRKKGSPPEQLPPAPTPVRVPRRVLERYVGVYEYIPGQMTRTDLRVMIRLAGDTLMRFMGGDEVPLVPVSETRFKVGRTSLVVEFVVDEAGVTQILGTGGQQMLARLAGKR